MPQDQVTEKHTTQESNVCICVSTPMLRAFISLSKWPPCASSYTPNRTSQLPITLLSDAAHTVQRVGHKMRKPGVCGASSDFSLSKDESLFGDDLKSQLQHQDSADVMTLDCLMQSHTPRLSVCPQQWV